MKNIPEIKAHTFFNKRYKVEFGDVQSSVTPEEMQKILKSCGIAHPEDVLALTDDRGTKGQTIIISDAIESDKELLRVLLDEGIHACDERLDNSIVDKYATDLSRFLWRCGYRRLA